MSLPEAEVLRRWSSEGSRAGLPDFDRVAGAYRWLEYLSLGTMLERARFWHLDAGLLDGCRRALVLGDGDGRFTQRLLRFNPAVRVEAVDLSAGMLRLLDRRCAAHRNRLRVRLGDARTVVPESSPDAVMTHFFLDCLTDTEVRALVPRLAKQLRPGGLWVVSEFQVPEGWLKIPARLLVRGLYLAFRVLTGLRVTRLPEYAATLGECGLVLLAEKRMLGGVLVSQVFVKGEGCSFVACGGGLEV